MESSGLPLVKSTNSISEPEVCQRDSVWWTTLLGMDAPRLAEDDELAPTIACWSRGDGRLRQLRTKQKQDQKDPGSVMFYSQTSRRRTVDSWQGWLSHILDELCQCALGSEKATASNHVHSQVLAHGADTCGFHARDSLDPIHL